MNNFECTGKVANTSEFELPKIGLVAAKCINVVDGRWVKNIYMGQDKGWVRKIFIIWEIEQQITKGQFAGENMTMVKEYTFAIGEKSNLRKDLISWRGGKDFEVRENADGTQTLITTVKKNGQLVDIPFSVDMLIGAYCILCVEHRETKAGTKYANISYVSPFDATKFTKLQAQKDNSYIPDWLAKKISERFEENPELENRQSNNSDSTSTFGDEDDVPF